MSRVEQIGECRLILGDCLEWMRAVPDCFRVDACITDPPFGVGNFVQVTGRLMGRGKQIGNSVDWNEQPPPPELFQILQRIAKHRIIWGANFFNCFEDRGGAIVWIKRQPMPNFSKADIASCTHFQKTEIVEIPWTNFEAGRLAETDHPCERPVELYEWCIRHLPNNPQMIFDPYMGSGSVGVAAIRQGRKFLGIERHEPYFDDVCRRLDMEYRRPRLFAEPQPKMKQEEMPL